MALIGVLLLLMMMSALAAALTVSGQTETLIVRNELAAAQAQAAAEAGINHAAEVVTQYIWDWKALGFANVDAAVNDVLADADAGSLDGLTTCTGGLDGCGVEHAIGTAATVTYYVEIVDDTTGEDGNALSDSNDAILIKAKGTASDGTAVVLEAIVTPIKLPALITGGNLTISGNVEISATDPDDASVHSNSNLSITGSAADIQGDATASGTQSCNPSSCSQVEGSHSSGATELPIPEVHASDYLVNADYVLQSTGQMTCNLSGGCTVGATTYAYNATICDASSNPHTQCRSGTTDFGWRFTGGTHWELNEANPTYNTGTYYVKGTPTTVTEVSASPTVIITIIAETSLSIAGSPDITPDTPELLFVTDGDLSISGGTDLGDPLTAQGQILVHEQLSISGGPDIAGQVIVEDAATLSSLVTSNSISGNAEITYNGNLGSSYWGISSWRDVRE
ncbi:MAG: hypothetical protein HY824_17490 [Acidobacteria bacterium]|nr:hypothetical protein [Acidobacteriota bacterium]